jgi:CheY-like chemotaxis protein
MPQDSSLQLPVSVPPVAALAVPRILLVDDDFVLRAHLAELLMLEGYAVTCAADGAEAVRRLEHEPPPSLIIVDMMLPRMDGLTFRRIQLRTASLRQIPTIAITGMKSIEHLGELAFAEVLMKPINLDRLMDVMGRLCRRA